MKILSILSFALLSGAAQGSLFFKDSKSDRIKANLENIGYDITDSAGLVKDSVIEAFDPESIDAFLEAHGIKQQGKNALAEAKKHKEWLLEDIRDWAEQSKDYEKALLQKGKEFYTKSAEAVADASAAAGESIWSKWSDSRLKQFLDARGFNVPQHSTRDQLLAHVARVKHRLPINFNDPTGTYWFDGWSHDELKQKLSALGERVDGSRRELVQRLSTAFERGYADGQKKGEEVAETIREKGDEAAASFKEKSEEAREAAISKWGQWKEASEKTFHHWSIEDLKDYLSEFGAEVEGKKDDLVAAAKERYYYFVHGESPPKTLGEKLSFHFRNTGRQLRGYLSRLLGSNQLLKTDL